MTALEWRKSHKSESDKGENIRDYASHAQLAVLANMESYNSQMINKGIDAKERTKELNDMARFQMPVFMQSSSPLLIADKDSNSVK